MFMKHNLWSLVHLCDTGAGKSESLVCWSRGGRVVLLTRSSTESAPFALWAGTAQVRLNTEASFFSQECKATRDVTDQQAFGGIKKDVQS